MSVYFQFKYCIISETVCEVDFDQFFVQFVNQTFSVSEARRRACECENVKLKLWCQFLPNMNVWACEGEYVRVSFCL
jgi:hypothetical protein